MQYKIPVQIENQDPIFLWLSLKQLIIIMAWWGIAYKVFQWLSPRVWWEVAFIPTAIIFLITLIIALFKYSEMTFFPYILNLIRHSINSDPKVWLKWVDSYQPIDIWYITQAMDKKENSIDTSKKIEMKNNLKEKLKNI